MSQGVSLVSVHILQLFLKDKAETLAMEGMSTFTTGCFLESTCEFDLIIWLFSHMVGVFKANSVIMVWK